MTYSCRLMKHKALSIAPGEPSSLPRPQGSPCMKMQVHALPRRGWDGTDPAEGTEDIRVGVLPVGCGTGPLGWRRDVDLVLQSLFIAAVQLGKLRPRGGGTVVARVAWRQFGTEASLLTVSRGRRGRRGGTSGSQAQGIVMQGHGPQTDND